MRNKTQALHANNQAVEGASEIKVTLFDGQELNAYVLGTDPNTDLALLKLGNANNIPSAQLGDSDDLRIEDKVSPSPYRPTSPKTCRFK